MKTWLKKNCPVPIIALIILSCHQPFSSVSQTWTQKADFGGGDRFAAVGFSISSKGYIGTGRGNGGTKNDFWEYDPNTDTWTQKADFGGAAREEAVGFSIGTKGYIGAGFFSTPPSPYTYTYLSDFWEYDPITNNWSQKTDYGGAGRIAPVGFSIGSKGYIGTGKDSLNGNVKNDFWEYDPTINTWSQKADFGGMARYTAVGFSIGSKGYLGLGNVTYVGTTNDSAYKKDFWEYDPNSDAWAQIANFSGAARSYAVGFAIGSIGYIGTGGNGDYGYNDFYKYDPSTNTWTQKANFAGLKRFMAVGFSIGYKGYIGTGSYVFGSFDDFWVWDSSSVFIENFQNEKYQLHIYPNPVGEYFYIEGNFSIPAEFKLYDILGREVISKILFNNYEKTEITFLHNGIYLLKISDGEKIYMMKFIKE